MASHALTQASLAKLRALGFSSYFEKQFTALSNQSLIPARIAIEHKDRYVIYTVNGESSAELSGKLRFSSDERPAVGDWVAVQHDHDLAIVHHIFKRKTKFSRIAPGTSSEEQIVAANIDIVFIVVGLDQNFNLRRTERYLVLTRESGADPVIVLNKSDLAEQPEDMAEQVASIAGNSPVISVSAFTGQNIERLKAYCSDGQTIALMGSSGVGKSSLINAILGSDAQAVAHTSDSNAKGRHTTTHRELIPIPEGGLIMDTPGMRELQLYSTEESLDESFEEIAQIAANCHFRDCTHDTEPGCAIQESLMNGELDQGRWKSYQKLQREIRRFEIKNDIHAMLKEKERWKQIHKTVRNKYNE